MDRSEFEKLDSILRVLFREGDISWFSVYTKLGLSKEEADYLYKIGHADGYIETKHKGIGNEGHYVGLTKSGISWFSKNNYVNTYVLKSENANPSSQSIVIQNSTVKGLSAAQNSRTDNLASQKSKSFWSNPWVITVGGGLILLLLTAIINWLF